jgi:ferredoxin like protein
MSTVDFRLSPRAHITLDPALCRSCTTHACLHVCPANLFVLTSTGTMLFNYEQCFECGACAQVCTTEGALSWSYPDGGHGVAFRQG